MRFDEWADAFEDGLVRLAPTTAGEATPSGETRQERPEVRDDLERDGYIIEGGTPDDFASFIKAEFIRWGTVIREEGIRVHTP